jgi:hypothetical protein
MAFTAGVRKTGERAVGLDRDSAPYATAWREVAVRDQENRAIKSLNTILKHLAEEGELQVQPEAAAEPAVGEQRAAQDEVS